MIRFFLFALLFVLPLAALAQQPFVPLTSIPGLSEGGNAATMTVFLNSLYKICIGAAAAIAVLQIIRAGILFMTNKGSVSENEQARQLVQGAVIGLILVLSPVIVFSIINPKILSLDFGVGALEATTPSPTSPTSPTAPSGTCQPIADGAVVTTDAEKTCCAQQEGFGVSAGSPSKCVKKTVTAAPTPPATVAKYGWIGRFYASTNCQSSGCQQITEKDGLFDTKAQCYASAGSVPAARGRGALVDPPGFSCNCDTTIGAQGAACSTLP